MELHYLQLFSVTVLFAIVAVFIAKERYHQLHDRIFIAIECCRALCLFIALRTLIGGVDDYTYLMYSQIVMPMALCVFPLVFLYVRMVLKDSKWHGYYWWVFTPAVFMGVANFILSAIVGWDNIISKRQANFATFVPDRDSLMENLYRWICVDAYSYVNVAMGVVFLLLCIYYLIGYYKKVKDYFANIEDSSFSRIVLFLGTTVLLLLTMMLIFLLVVYVPQVFRDEVIVGFNLWVAVLSCVVAYFAYQIRLTEEQADVLEIVDIHNGNDNFMAHKVKQWVTHKDKPYCMKGLTVRDVANDLCVSPRLLSTFIKEHEGMRFNGWINAMRIEEAKRRLRTSSDVKIIPLATELGFYDHSAFSKVFRRIVGMSPQDYRDAKGK